MCFVACPDVCVYGSSRYTLVMLWEWSFRTSYSYIRYFWSIRDAMPLWKTPKPQIQMAETTTRYQYCLLRSVTSIQQQHIIGEKRILSGQNKAEMNPCGLRSVNRRIEKKLRFDIWLGKKKNRAPLTNCWLNLYMKWVKPKLSS